MAGTKRQQLQRHARHAGRPHESARSFYKRIAVKFSRRSTQYLSFLEGSELGTVDRVARDWRGITQCPPCDSDAQDRLFASLPPRLARVDLTAMDAPFTVDEVLQAIKACPRGNACGPDGLGNDWYHDLADTLAALLAPLYTRWYDAGVLPGSFVHASVFCVPKKSTPLSGLDFRPIALLNTDYKIYSRLLLRRLRDSVAKLVVPTQYGFVPGWQVHDAIDVWTALQRRAAEGELPPGSLAVFLDFAKAYDSLDRRFLSLALRRHGFSEALISAVSTMHLGTTAAYIVDGQTSAPEDVLTGIRQGCPFAPTLFILAVDVLYEMIQQDPRLPGLPLTDSLAVTLVGFADDTTAYLQSPVETHVLLEVLHEFALVSGLKVNSSKSMAVFIASCDHLHLPESVGFPLAGPKQLIRYLGVQIGTSLELGAVWDITINQLRARLLLAAIKTTDLLQRVQVCQAVVLPKILFVARHAWPSPAIVKRLQRFLHNYAWYGVLQNIGLSRRAWMNENVAAAPRAAGGLQLPHLHDELLVLSATTVSRWLSATEPVAFATGQVFAARTTVACTATHVAPARGPAPAPKLYQSLSISDWALLRKATVCPRDDEDAMLLCTCWRLLAVPPSVVERGSMVGTNATTTRSRPRFASL